MNCGVPRKTGAMVLAARSIRSRERSTSADCIRWSAMQTIVYVSQGTVDRIRYCSAACIVYDMRVTSTDDQIARPEPLRISVHRRVVGLMTSGELEPGQTITEAGLSKSLGVS